MQEANTIDPNDLNKFAEILTKFSEDIPNPEVVADGLLAAYKAKVMIDDCKKHYVLLFHCEEERSFFSTFLGTSSACSNYFAAFLNL